MFFRHILILPIALLLADPLCAWADANCAKVVISSHPSYPPTTWYDGQQLRGGWPAIAAKVFGDLGIPYEVKYQGPWIRVVEAARSGTVDVLATLKENDERRTFLTFTTAGGTPAPITVFVRRDAQFGFKGKFDLIGKRGGTTRGEGFGQEIDHFVANLNVEQVGEFTTNLKKMAAGRLDYAISGYYPGTSKLAMLGLQDEFVALKPNLTEEVNHFGFVTNSPCMKYFARFDKHLAELLKDGTVARLLDENAAYWRLHPTAF